ncbi:uncharacterized protein METZ01_LOCUS84223 [marine metagenome]|uniref:Glycosyltransferase RgtA/B/C/D-like domain-containing protein n=1 Tax=marine metagenome TaxID=408172 RepID=A0A381UTB5_9ZZZZ
MKSNTARKIVKLDYIYPCAITFIVLAVYLATMPTSLSWGYKNFGIDSPELLTSAQLFGIPHPPGYPLYMLLLGTFLRILPFADPALVGNLFSVLTFLPIIPILYSTILKLFASHTKTGGTSLRLCSAISVMIFCFLPVIWGVSTVTEVYALNILLVIILFWASVSLVLHHSRSDRISRKLLIVLSVSIGLGLSNHLTFLGFAVPILFWIGRKTGLRIYLNPIFFFPILLGVCLYAYLPIRTATAFPTNWGDSDTLGGFLWMVRAAPYGGYFSFPWNEPTFDHVLWPMRLIFSELGPVIIFLTLIGLRSVYTFDRNLVIVSVISAILFLGYGAAYRTADSEVNVTPVLMLSCVFAGGGMLQLFHIAQGWGNRSEAVVAGFRRISRRILPNIVISAFLLLLPFFLLMTNFTNLDFSNDRQALIRGREIHNMGNQNSVFLLSTELDVFTTWYVRYVEQPSSIKLPIAVPLLQFDWYRKNIPLELGEGESDKSGKSIENIAKKIAEASISQGRDIYIADAYLYKAISGSVKEDRIHLIEW